MTARAGQSAKRHDSLKVVMVIGRSTGGIGTHVAELSANLRAQGTDVIVVTDTLTAERFDLGQVRLWWPVSAGWHGGLRDFRRLRQLASTSDIVHAHGHQAALLAILATLGARAGAPSSTEHAGGTVSGPVRPRNGAAAVSGRVGHRPKVVVTQHNAVLEGSGRRGLKRLAQRWVARRADLVTGVSQDLVAEALALGAHRVELADVPAPRVPELLAQELADPLTRALVRAMLLRSLGEAPSDQSDQGVLPTLSVQPDVALPLVVTISRIAPQKNLPVLVEAASMLRNACTWVVLGDGEPELLASLEQQALALRAPVHFAGARRDADQWLRAAEVFVLASQWEGQPLVVREAMAAGTPVVATDVGGLHDMVSGTGLLVIPGDPAAIANATDRVLDDPALRSDLAARGRAVAEALPDGRDTATRWLGLYAETLRMT